jgi:hypothetical protein
MTVMIPRYFGIPQSLYRSREWRTLKTCEKELLIYLYHESEYHSARQLRRSDAQICETTGLCKRSLLTARNGEKNKRGEQDTLGILARGLASFELMPDGFHLWTLHDPETMQPWPGDPRTPVRYIPKRAVQAATPEPTRDNLPPREPEPPRESQTAPDTSFPFGHNERKTETKKEKQPSDFGLPGVFQ